jgi:hypothetical protein
VPIGNLAGGGAAVAITRARVTRLNTEGRVQLAVLAVVAQAGTAITIVRALVATSFAAVIQGHAGLIVAAATATTGAVLGARLTVGDTLIDRALALHTAQ